MRTGPNSILLLLAAGFGAGCASPYMKDRGRDAADIFTLTVGTGYGAKVRVGPLQPGYFTNHDRAGLRGGRLTGRFAAEVNGAGETVLFSHGLDCRDYFVYGDDNFRPDDPSLRKDYYARSYHPFWSHVVYPVDQNYYYSQIEVAAGLGGTVRVGFNPGELLDFVLGWTTIDLYRDDIEQQHLPDDPRQLVELLAATETNSTADLISAPRLSILAHRKLSRLGTSAFPALVASMDDPRPTWDDFQQSRMGRTTVGMACVALVAGQVEPQKLWKGTTEFLTDGNIADWWRRSQGRSLRELRVEALRWTLSEARKMTWGDAGLRKGWIDGMQTELDQLTKPPDQERP